MRRIIVIEFITLDGVLQAPGGPEEDRSGDFEYGGWSAPFSDEVLGNVMQQQMQPAGLLLGRQTFEIFEAYWPAHAGSWPGINEVTKFVVTETRKDSNWNNCIFLKGIEEVRELKNSAGTDLKVWGSSKLVHTLLKENLVDELWLKIYPVVLGKGKRLFHDEAIPAAFTLTESAVSTKGVIIANYKRSGKVETGSLVD